MSPGGAVGHGGLVQAGAGGTQEILGPSRRRQLGHQWEPRLDHAAVVASHGRLGKLAAGPLKAGELNVYGESTGGRLRRRPLPS